MTNQRRTLLLVMAAANMPAARAQTAGGRAIRSDSSCPSPRAAWPTCWPAWSL